MSLKDIWKDKVDGVDDVRAEDINAIANEAIRLDNESEDNLNETKLRDERLKYYGDPDIVPTEDSFFKFITDDETMTAVAQVLYNKEIEELVIPYEYVIGDKVYSIIRLVYTDTYESYQNKSSVNKVIIPNAGIVDIGDMVFSNTRIRSIDIPECVYSLSGQTFTDCSDLTNITLSENISNISHMAFNGCDNLTITCVEGSYADEYAQIHNIPVEYTKVSKQFILDSRKPDIVKAVADTLVLKDNQDAQLGEISSLVLAMPENVDFTYRSSFNFKSGEIPTNLTYTDTPIIWCGDDCDEDGDFVPESNVVYEVSVKNLGANGIVARVCSNTNEHCIPLWKPNTHYDVGDIVIYPYGTIDEDGVRYLKCEEEHISGKSMIDLDEENHWKDVPSFRSQASVSAIIAGGISAYDKETTEYLGDISGKQIYDVVQFVGDTPNETGLKLLEILQELDDKFVINITLKYDSNNTITVDTIDRTFDEIKNAYLSNKTMVSKLKIPLVLASEDDMGEEITETLYPYLINNNYVYDDTVDTFVFEFSGYIQQGVNRLEHSSPYCIYVNIANGGIKLEEIPIASTTLVDDYIGDIETALDSIIEIQNKLMGVSE